MAAPLPDGEQERLAVLDGYRLLDTEPEDAYEDIVRLAAHICGTPVAAVTLVADHKQYFKAKVGLPLAETPRDVAFCAHTILQKDLLVVPDACADARFAANPLVTGDPSIRFYAGAPLITAGGHALGSLCVIDRVPRKLTPDQERALRALSRRVVDQMERARQVATQQRLIAAVGRAEASLRQSYRRLEDVLESMSDAVLVLDKDWRCTYVNPEAARAFRRLPEDMIGRNFWAEFPEGVGLPFYEAYSKALAEQTPLQIEEYYPPTGRWFENRIYPSADGLAVFSHDVTDRKKAEQERLAAEKARQRTLQRAEQTLQISTALGGALTTAEVVEVIFQAALPVLQARAGLVALLSEDGTTLHTAQAVGVPSALSGPLREFSVDSPVPLADAVRERRLVALTSPESRDAAYPNLLDARSRVNTGGALVAVPLLVGERCIGGIGLICPPEHCHGEGQQAFLWTLAGQCALALERARLHDEARREMEERLRAEEARRESEANFRSIIDSSPVAFALNDELQNITFLNAEFVRTFGYTLDDIPTLADWWPRAYPDPNFRQWVMTTWQDRLERARQEGTVFEAMELTIRCKDGAERTVLAGVSPLGVSLAGTHLVSLYDITDRKRAEGEKVRLVEYNRLLLESTAEGIYGMDTQGCCTFINRAATLLLGYTAEEVLGRGMHALIHHSHEDGSPYPVEECPIYMTFRHNLPCRVETEVLWRRDGTCFHASYSSLPMSDTSGVVGAVVTFSDITERKRVEREREESLAEAQEQADRDPLTGLLNHRAFYNRLDAEAARVRRENTTLAIVMLDLDGFKFFNDAYGHVTGDEVLRLVAGRLRAACRSYDTLARFGGDEFALLLPNVGHATGEEVEARLRAVLRGMSCRVGSGEVAIPVSISLGAALFPDGGTDSHMVLRQADERLHWAKTGGGVEENAQRVRADATDRIHGFSMLDALVTAVDNKDRYTRRHSEDVMEYSLMIARELGLDEARQRAVAVSALLHDVGKIGVPDAILRKPGRLTEEEFEAVKQHPQMGAVMVQAVPGLEETLDAVRHHHERWDGAGYPDGLRGETTPLIARLMAVADAFSAMTTDRPYRQGMNRAAALDILAAGVGTQWDPACVAGFLRAQRHGTREN